MTSPVATPAGLLTTITDPAPVDPFPADRNRTPAAQAMPAP